MCVVGAVCVSVHCGKRLTGWATQDFAIDLLIPRAGFDSWNYLIIVPHLRYTVVRKYRLRKLPKQSHAFYKRSDSAALIVLTSAHQHIASLRPGTPNRPAEQRHSQAPP